MSANASSASAVSAAGSTVRMSRPIAFVTATPLAVIWR
jgi:hypothetical protein